MEFISKSLTISVVLVVLLVSRANAQTNATDDNSTTTPTTIGPTTNATVSSTSSAGPSTNATVSSTSSALPSSTTEEPPFTFSTCSNCNSMNITNASSQSKLLLCCASFSRCCAQANAISCPTTTSTTRHSCSNFGPFCSDNDNCPFGSMCCKPTIGGQNFRCCWTPR